MKVLELGSRLEGPKEQKVWKLVLSSLDRFMLARDETFKGAGWERL